MNRKSRLSFEKIGFSLTYLAELKLFQIFKNYKKITPFPCKRRRKKSSLM